MDREWKILAEEGPEAKREFLQGLIEDTKELHERLEDGGVEVRGRFRRIDRHYGPGPHPGTGTPQEVHAGDGAGSTGGKKQVGITSNRPGMPPEEVFEDMREFEGKLREIEGVRNVSVKPGVGGWEGGEEPTWVVQFEGDGEALKLIAETGKQHNQDAVLIMESPGEGNRQPVVDWEFNEPITPDERDAIQETLVDSGIGGWTWFRSPSGQTVLRAVAVPQWGGDANEHLRSADLVSDLFRQVGYAFEREDGEVGVQIMEREGENSYDRLIGAE